MEVTKVLTEVGRDTVTKVHLRVIHKRLNGKSVEEGWRELRLLGLDLLHDGVVLSICFSIHAKSVDFVLDRFHLLLRFFASNFLLHFDCFDLGLGLSLDARLFSHRVCLLLLHLLLLFGDLQMRL